MKCRGAQRQNSGKLTCLIYAVLLSRSSLLATAGVAVAQDHPAATDRPSRPGWPTRRRSTRRPWRALAVAGGFRHRAQHRSTIRQARLHGDGRHVVAVRSIRRTLGGDLLHGLCREVRQSGGATGDLCLQWRSGCGIGVSQSRPGRSAHRRIRHERPRRLERPADRQSRHLARLHRSRPDRSGRHRLEPRREARRRQSVLGRRRGRAIHGQGHRALCRQEQPRRLAEIHSRRKLWRLPRRQGRARPAERPGHRGVRAS